MDLAGHYQAIRRLFHRAGIASAGLDARLLIQMAGNIGADVMMAEPGRHLSPDQVARLYNDVTRRLGGEPVSRILGHRAFWKADFKITADTLDPRPDTETLVEAALAWARAQVEPVRILDLGTGCGCILISLLGELPHAGGVGVDISPGAIRVSRENAQALGVASRADFRCGSWFEPLEPGARFDLIVANPPYIAESAMESLAIEVKNHDPRAALTDEKEGFEAYKVIYPQLGAWLKPGGRAFFEMGFDQLSTMTRLVDDSHATLCSVHKDLAGHARVVELSLDKETGISEKKVKIPR